MKKERPILFSTPMVQALLERRKTQTRRIVTPQPLFKTARKFIMPDDSPNKWHDCDDVTTICPYGAIGDILWVRETWNHYYSGDDHCYSFRASDPEFPFSGWKPSIHMPKSVARIWLEITDIRLERLNDISENDAKEEGLAQVTKDNGRTWKYGIPDKDGLPGTDNSGWPWQEWELSPVVAYKKLWTKINGQESTESNPWIWVIQFKILSTTSKPETL